MDHRQPDPAGATRGAKGRRDERREKRRTRTAEVFTPAWLVDEMLDRLPRSAWAHGTCLDPACGSGNMLVRVLRRKIDAGHAPADAIRNVFGTDIMQDNVRECRLRLLKEAGPVSEDMIRTVFTNIRYTPTRLYGALGYQFSFSPTTASGSIAEWSAFSGRLQEIDDRDLMAIPVGMAEREESEVDLFGYFGSF